MHAAQLFDAAELRKAIEPYGGASPVESLAALAQDSRGFSADWTWQRPSGGSRRVNVAASPWRDVRGELLGYLLVAVDVTEREAAMRALDRARTDLERSNTLKTSFLSNVSHEIRTPMTSILGCADLLLEEGAAEAERAEFARTIRRNGEHLLEVLNDILDITRIEAGRLRIERIEVKLGEVLDEVSTLMAARAKARGLTFTVRSESEHDLAVLTDPLRIRQVLVNLIGNAIKFTERGSVAVDLRTRVEGDNLCADFIVRDTGIGISPEQAASLFVDFAQATSSTARRHGGTGLGLAISQRLAHLLDGSISLQSEIGRGSAFTFSMQAPLSTAAIAVSGDDAPQPIRLDGRDVLLVGLQEHAAEIAAVLRQAGATVLSVTTPTEVFAAADLSSHHERFNAILIDMRLPDLAGYDTARELRASGFRGRLIALTEDSALDDRDRCTAAGFDDQGVLPVPRARLLRLCSPTVSVGGC
jgi:signal transduction histidine kinase/CheY-like chemotaxis protein